MGRMADPTTATGPATGTGWYPVARSSDVGTRPLPVGAAGRAWVVVRLRPGAEVSAFPARCPHRLVPLATATVVDGRLQCAHHGWQFDGEGRCRSVPSLGETGTPPPRADLAVPWAVEERSGWVWLAPDPATAPRPPRPESEPRPECVPAPEGPAGPAFGNLHPALESAWHPVALSTELRDGGWLAVRLLGRTWTLHRDGGVLSADPPAHGVRERLGLVWLAPAEPRDVPLEVPEAADPRFVPRWLPPVRAPGPAGPLADTLLDAAHTPFVHAGGHGRVELPAPDVVPEPGGFRGRQELGRDGSADARGERPRRVATWVHRAPFQLRLRLESPPSGAVTTVLYLLQPEDADSTRVHTCVLLSAGPGEPLVSPATVAAVAARRQELLAEDAALQARVAATGLPLVLRDELHLPADRLGVALRRALADFARG
jgi:phenylpropionate dioxygenase-like ring-hydroxylating dioxygenase large terminal subunit